MKTKPAKTATKKPAKLAPIVVTSAEPNLLAWTVLHALLSARSTRQLKEDLRARSLPIPKTKDEMVDRLSVWARRDGGTFTLTLR
jgi:hypothetical protein